MVEYKWDASLQVDDISLGITVLFTLTLVLLVGVCYSVVTTPDNHYLYDIRRHRLSQLASKQRAD